MEGKWTKDVSERVNELKEQLTLREFNFYQLNKLIIIAEVLDRELAGCSICNELMSSLMKFVNELPDSTQNRELRITYETDTEKLVKHLRKEHGFYLQKFYNYTWSFYGMLVGVICGVMLAFSGITVSKASMILTCWFGGLVIGRIAGGWKDRKLKKAGKQI
ncbi:MAG: hypothetical protein ABIJ16_08500 [Bacteroidota bacterium]